MKYLLVLVVVVAGLWMLSARFRRKSDQSDRSDHAPQDPAARARQASDRPDKKPEEMVACGHCGMHLPAKEAVYRGEVPFCGVAHLEAGPR